MLERNCLVIAYWFPSELSTALISKEKILLSFNVVVYLTILQWLFTENIDTIETKANRQYSCLLQYFLQNYFCNIFLILKSFGCMLTCRARPTESEPSFLGMHLKSCFKTEELLDSMGIAV